ncbi:S41 family peptidase [Streptomyces sp. NPDC003077]|uniref:S41 family peptidase n=1 Tax=Streptomyces sp. NPDC003077 TaxID=3154443 RepID=UPI0033BD807E
MSGPWLFVRPRRIRRGAALTLVFTSVLVTGAAAGSWGENPGTGAERRIPAPGGSAPATPRRADRQAVEDAVTRAMKAGESGAEAASGVVSRGGDRWSTVYTAGEYAGFRQELDGVYVGTGLWVRQAADGWIEVARTQPGSPAAEAGVRAGDVLRAVDGTPVRHHPVTDVVARLRGDLPKRPNGAPRGRDRDAPVGSRVALELRRGEHTWTEALRRVRLKVRNVTTEWPAGADGPLRIKVDTFAKGTGEEVRRAVRAASRRHGILLDLRGNTGGLVTEAVTAASAFLDGGLVATYDVHGSQRALYAEDGGDTAVPLVVVVDGGTMSAAELLTGALQDRGRAVVVGSPTFGKGAVQMPSELPDGSVAELTVGHYRTPSGRAVDGRGIAPDLNAEDGTERRARTVLWGLGG